jgi:hypothetical protein
MLPEKKEGKDMKNNKLDKTRIVMIALFAVLVIGSAVGFLIASVTNKNTAETETEIPEEIIEEETPLYKNYEELADRFIEICRAGDTEAMYGLYYDDLLTKRREEMGAPKQEYDSIMLENMQHITDFEEYRYGEGELIMNTPAQYVNQFFYRANEKAFPYTDVVIDDFVDLRAYFSNGAYIDFMLAKIDGFWYMVV